MHTIGVVAGSFDPITRGHERLIQEAARLVDHLHVVIGVNPVKKYMFTDVERREMVEAAIKDLPSYDTPIEVHFVGQQLTIDFAKSVGATHLIRGIRDPSDFPDEVRTQLFNRKMAPEVETIFVISPPELAEVSSSMVRGLVGFENWEQTMSRYYAHPAVVEGLRRKVNAASENKIGVPRVVHAHNRVPR